jgi:hypothetical protein
MDVFRRARPPAAPANDDDEWDAAIWHAKMRAASSRMTGPAPRLPTLHVPPEMQATPPPLLARQAPRARVPEQLRARLGIVAWGSPDRPPVLRPVPRRPAEEDVATPPPLAPVRLYRPARRP